MRKLFLIAGLMTAFLLIVLAASAQNKPNFAGTWTLDKSTSQGLSQGMQNAESVTWTITQDDKQISIDSKVVAGQSSSAAAGGGGGSGGGGGRGAGAGMGGPRTYTIDGKEVSTDAGGQMGGKNTTKTTWSGDSLELSSVRTGNFNGNEFKATTTEKLSLSGDGKILTVVRHSESPRGAQDSTLVFNKQ